jgi:TPP-dependent pyruvate/acetoin dehydrogenase alpha subunit
LDEVHVIFFGDGASSSNGFHSGLNFAGVWKAPCVFVLVHNGWAISVSSRNQTAANSYSAKGTAYGVEGREVDGNCALACYQALKEATDSARRGAGPQLVVLNTYRMGGHSSSDDPSKYRDEAEVDEWRDKDPIERMTRFLEARGSLAAGAVDELRDELFMELDTVIRTQEAAPRMSWRTLVEDVYADVPPHLRQQYNQFLITQEKYGEASPSDGAFPL